MALKAVLFDLGGTLVGFNYDGLRLSRKALRDYLSQKGYDVTLDRVVQISKKVWDMYSIFADNTLIEVNFENLMKSILYQLQIEDYANNDLIAEAIKNFYYPIVKGSYLLSL